MQATNYAGLKLALLSIAVVSLALVAVSGVTVADEDRRVDGEREIEDTIVEPGDQIAVKVTFELENKTHLDIVEGIKPAVGDVEPWTLEHHETGQTSWSSLSFWNENGGVILFDDLPAGNYTFGYNVTVDENALTGETYRFDGGIQEATDPIETRTHLFEDGSGINTAASLESDELSGDSQLTVGGAITVTSDQPDNQTVEVDFGFSGDTDAHLDLVSDNETVKSTTINGTAGTTQTANLSLAGLSVGDYDVELSADNSGQAQVNDTRMVTHQPAALNVSENETVAVDVGFNAETLSNATVTFEQSGTQLNSTTVEFDPIEADDGTGVETVEWEATTSGEIDVTVETAPVESYGSVVVSTDDSGLIGGGGIVGGVEARDIPRWAKAIGLILVVVGVGAAIVRVS